jgi:hypothetical protein
MSYLQVVIGERIQLLLAEREKAIVDVLRRTPAGFLKRVGAGEGIRLVGCQRGWTGEVPESTESIPYEEREQTHKHDRTEGCDTECRLF